MEKISHPKNWKEKDKKEKNATTWQPFGVLHQQRGSQRSPRGIMICRHVKSEIRLPFWIFLGSAIWLCHASNHVTHARFKIQRKRDGNRENYGPTATIRQSKEFTKRVLRPFHHKKLPQIPLILMCFRMEKTNLPLNLGHLLLIAGY